MKIDFTKEQYGKLVQLLYAGNLLLNDTRNANEKIQEYDEICNYVYSKYKEFESEDIVTYNDEYNMLSLTQQTEKKVLELAQVYNEEIFWLELVERFTDREIKEKGLNPSFEERNQIRNKYCDMFENNDFKKLRIDCEK